MADFLNGYYGMAIVLAAGSGRKAYRRALDGSDRISAKIGGWSAGVSITPRG
jgi:hypothetical protein